MRPITYGETLKKVEILDSKNVENFLEKNTREIQSLLDKKCVYSSGVIVEDPVTNYINIVSNKNVDRVLKSLLVKEYVQLEKTYPKLGETFIKHYFDKNFTIDSETILFHKDTFEDFCVGRHGNGVKILIKKDEEGSNRMMVKSPFFMKGYITKKGYEPPKSFDGYYDTGDIGDYKNDLLYIKGRKRDIIKRGGEKKKNTSK